MFGYKNYKVYFDFDVHFTGDFFFLNSYVSQIVRFIYCSEKVYIIAGKIYFFRIFIRIESKLC